MNVKRRDFLGLSLAAAGGVFAPRFGRWFRRGSGLLVPGDGLSFNPRDDEMAQMLSGYTFQIAWHFDVNILRAGI